MKKIFPIIILIATIFMGIGYALVNSISLSIEGKAVAKDQTPVFITEVNYENDINADLSNSKILNTQYTMMKSTIVLSNTDSLSEVTYSITVYNSTNDVYYFDRVTYLIGNETYSNEDIIFELEGLNSTDSLPAKSTITFKIKFSYKNNQLPSSNILNSYLNFRFINDTLSNTILSNNEISYDCPIEYNNTNLYVVNSVETSSKFCKAVDNYGDTYYFRGSSSNNYVSFAGYTWRVMRVNGTNSVRLIYDGGIGNVNMATNGTTKDNAYIGYMYGTSSQTSYELTHTDSTDSLLKSTLDTWYENNILNKYDEYIDDMYVFNDRTTYKNYSYDSIVNNPVSYYTWGSDTGLGYGTNTTYYGTWLRLVQNIENYYSNNIGSDISYPTYYCLNEKDCYTSSSNLGYGNAVLKYPIATITMDDAIFAGANYKEQNANDSTYIYTGQRFHLLAFPVMSSNTVTPICSLMGTHSLGNGWITCGSRGNFQIRPVINVKGDLIVTSGDGTKEFPYTLTIKEPSLTEEDIVNNQISQMTLKEKIGQMIFVNASSYGTSVSSSFSSMLTTVKPGGIVVFSSNVESYNQLKTFISDVNETATIPLIWSIDQEGGRVQRLTEENVGATTIPYMYDLGLSNDTNLSYNVGKVIAEELRVFGFNMDFAPVADIWSNSSNTVIGKRAFGTTYDTVSKMIIPFAKGLEDSDVIAVYKHFPGHGDTTTDSHYTLPVITKTKDELLESEIIPFKTAIENGAKVIMMGHLAVPSLTGDYVTPTSLSKETITDFLKGELGFEGLVITDGLNMNALSEFTEEEIYTKAINAGVDILLMPKDEEEALNIIYNSVINGVISEDTINASVKKILTLKQSLSSNILDQSYLGSVEHKEIIEQINVSE